MMAENASTTLCRGTECLAATSSKGKLSSHVSATSTIRLYGALRAEGLGAGFVFNVGVGVGVGARFCGIVDEEDGLAGMLAGIVLGDGR